MNTTDPLQLKCGNPDTRNSADNPASFSRFVFPFAYCLERLDELPQGLCFQPQKNGDVSDKRRIKYLTNETALVLFERAKWFEIAEETWKKTPWEDERTPITITLKTGTFQIKMLPPAVVLFEFSEDQECTKNSVLQTGFLYVDIFFPEQNPLPIFDDFLLLNEIFRYFDAPHGGHAAYFKSYLKNIPIDYPINSGHYRTVASADDQESYFVRWLNLLNIPIKYEGNYYKLIPDDWMESAKKWVYHADIQQSNSENESCLAHVDNRCYVWTAAFIDKGGHALDTTFNVTPTEDIHAHHFGHWVKLLNVDDPGDTPQETHQKITGFEKKWADTKTYKRWQHDGSWYGFNNHSGVMLAGLSPPLHLCRVFREQYFDQTLLLLYLRTTLFRFSRKLSLIVHEQQRKQQDDNKEWLEQIRHVRLEFSLFAILYQFPSLSNQQQGIEMYALARECLDVDVLYREVQEEIANTHDFLEQAEANKLGSAANILAEWGIPLGVASVVASLFGMNIYGLSKDDCTQDCLLLSNVGVEIVMVVLSVVVSVVAMFFYKKHKK